MTEEKVRTFGFASEAGAQLFVDRLDRRDYSRVKDGSDLKIGDFTVKRERGEVQVLVWPMGAKDLASLWTLASMDRQKAGEPKRYEKKEEPSPPKPEPPSKMKARAASAAKAHTARKAKRVAVVETPPQMRAEITTPPPANGNGTSPLAALIADYESRRDRLQLVIDNLRAAERVMAEG